MVVVTMRGADILTPSGDSQCFSFMKYGQNSCGLSSQRACARLHGGQRSLKSLNSQWVRWPPSEGVSEHVSEVLVLNHCLVLFFFKNLFLAK